MKKLILIIALLTLFINVKGQDTIFVYQENGMIRIDDFEAVPVFMTPGQISYKLNGSNFVFKDGLTKIEYNIGIFSEIFNKDTIGFSTQNEAIDYLNTILNRRVNDVNIQDQTTDPIIVNFNRIDASTTLKDTVAIGDTSIVLTSATGADVGDYLIIFNPDLLRFYKGIILSIDTDTMFLDTPLDVAYPAGSFVDLTTTNMAVDGSVTTQIFGVRGVSPSPIGIAVDITRIIVQCQTATAVDLSKFGDLAALTNGLVLRKRDGRYFNIFNIKTNGELAALGYDWTPYLATNPQQGQDGFLFRLTFAGMNKLGVAIRLRPGEDLQFLVQDDLSGITVLEITAEGHVVFE